MNAPSEPVRATAGIGRRLLAVLCNAALLVLVGVGAVRYVADITQERIPPSMTDAGADVCATLDQQVTTTWCEVRGDRVYYSSVERPFVRAALPPLAVSFANSVLLTWLTGASLGKHLLGLRVVRRRDGRRAGLLTHLLRWPLWPVASLGALVVRAGTRPASTEATDAGQGAPVDPAATGAGVAPDRVTHATATADAGTPPPTVAPDPLPVVDPARPVARATAPAESWWPFADADADADAAAAGTAARPDTDTAEGAPEVAAAVPPTDAAAPTDTVAAAGPRWDAARQAYIQWEPVSMRWMIYDATAERWIPLTEGS